MIKSVRCAAGTLLLALSQFSGVALADEAGVDRDTRCLVAILKMTASGLLPNDQGQVAALYFFARLDAQDPNLDLTSKMAELIKSMSQQEIGQEGIRCGAEMHDRSGKLIESGKALTAMGL